VHAIAHPVGSWFNTHHGLTNAVILPYVMIFNRRAIADKADVIARVLDLPKRGFDGFLAWVLDMRRELGIPHALADIGVSVDKAAIIGREAAIDPSAGGNPIPVDAAQLEHIFRAAVAGRLEAVDSAA
jgi:alcohol dehydrogenase class IV